MYSMWIRSITKNTLKIHVETIHEKYTRFGCKICEYVAPHNNALKTMLYLGIPNPNHQNVVYASTNLANIKNMKQLSMTKRNHSNAVIVHIQYFLKDISSSMSLFWNLR